MIVEANWNRTCCLLSLNTYANKTKWQEQTLTNWKGKPEDGLNLNMFLARSAWWDEHETGECVGLETNFMKLNSYGINI